MQPFPDINAVISWKQNNLVIFTHVNTRLHPSKMIHDEHIEYLVT